MCCCKPSKWRSERKEVQDHKFDFVDIDDFYENSFTRKLKYSLVFLVVLKTILVYVADLWTAGILLIFDRWGSTVKPKIPFFVSKWIYVIAILMSFIILAWDIKKARPIVASRDISYTFTSLVATRFYTLKSYSHYCFFCQIQESTTITDSVAFFIYFTSKGWKRLILAELPRQAINAMTLYSIIQSNKTRRYWNISAYGDTIVQRLAMALMAFTLIVFIFSFSLLILAFIMYIPLLCHIRGNLKEYCCHKVDKRIAFLLKMKSKKRVMQYKQQAEAKAKGDYNHMKKSGDAILLYKEPTLPIFEDDNPKKPLNTHLGIPPPYISRPGSPAPPYISRPGTPGYPSRPGTPGYPIRVGSPALVPGMPGFPSRPGTPGYGQVKPYGPPNGQQPTPVLTRRNSVSSVTSGTSAYSSTTSYGLAGPGGYQHPYGPPSRSQTPPTIQPKHDYDHNLIARAVFNNAELSNRQINTPSESGNDDDSNSEYGGSQSSLGDNTATKPLINRQNTYRAPSSIRSYSTVSSRSNSSSRTPTPIPTGSHPSRYQHDNRTPRYNNYTQQGGGLNRN
ncbi:16117_t:CDS:2 [Funneliformis geosporum]|uniref:18183_t:CDS:1 n=1 Tax=Funneliformis geosporum TaxID=1117311 RepID=A0A9W4WK11_9GLOM|nr:16117_t:CDS:2 [Funneliformis geosporum]CAI2167330.1 18183_t:CDS:2 [Funneliformis geosporum]